MTNSPFVRSLIVQAALEIVSPLIRSNLLKDSGFRQEYNLKADAILVLTEAGVSFQRSALFEAAREVLSGVPGVEVIDTNETKWYLANSEEAEKLPALVLSRGDQHLALPDLSSLAANDAMRLRALDENAVDVNLPSDAYDRWRRILAVRPFGDDELDEYQSEFRDTPVAKARIIGDTIAHRQEMTISALVPTSRRYYERLVGIYDGSISPREYAVRAGRTHQDRLRIWRPYDGLLFSLLLSSHSSITAEINVDQLSGEDLVRAFDFLDKHGDRISQLGAIEVGLRVLATHPEVEPVLIRLIDQIRYDDVDAKTSGFSLLSGLFFIVDGELSRTRLFSAEPPFYRRLASLAHSALIQGQLVNAAVDTDQFSSWAFESRGEQYYMQSLADMRPEPRWNPDYGAAAQIKFDFFGRIMNTTRYNEQNLRGTVVFEQVLGDEPESLRSLSDLIHPYLPGPLEGSVEAQLALPAEIAAAIRTQLSGEELTPASFIALVNSALIFRVATDEAELAAKALKLGSYRLANVENKSQLLAILEGLGTVAAVTRSTSLADELRILVRRYRSDAEYKVSADEAMRVCLVAAASHADIHSWRNFLGDWLTELAFGDLEPHEGIALYSHLQCLLLADPGLWATCGRADAALIAFQARSHSDRMDR